jgi:aryl sulfotransferase
LWDTVLSESEPDINSLHWDGPSAADRRAFENALGLCSSDLTEAEVKDLRPRSDDVIAAEQTRLVLRKVHDALPVDSSEPTISLSSAQFAIYVVRDPRDVAVSLAHHMAISLPEAVEMMLTRAVIGAADRPDTLLQQHLSSWPSHVESWTSCDRLPVFVVRYEDALTDPAETFGHLFRRIGIDVEPSELTTAVDRVRFDRLAAQEAAHGFQEKAPSSSPFFRSGKAQGWKEVMPPPLVRRFSELAGSVMKRLGYD